MNVSLEKIAPPVAFVVVGFALLVIGATGIVPIGNPQPVISAPLLKGVVLGIGILLILAAIIAVWRESQETKERAIGGFVAKNQRNSSLSTLDIDLNGKWRIYYGSDIKKISEHNAGSAEISQRSNQLRMTVSLFMSKDYRSIDRTFENIGVIENRQIITQFRCTYPKSNFMIGTMVLYVDHDGKKIRGGATYIDDKGKVIVDKVVLARD